ncbi:MAG: hypothetical protein ACRC6V_02205 [Bacteroidales bacterium]
MSSYGLELIAPSGNSFIIPDNNPMTFHHRFDMPAAGSAGGVAVLDTGIPVHVKTMFFWKLVTSNSYVWDTAAWVNTDTGTYRLFAQTGNVIPGEVFQVYAFCDRVLKDVTGGVSYGLQIWDSEGNHVFGNESKPLRMYVDQTPPFGEYVQNYSYPTSQPTAYLLNALTNYTPSGRNTTYYTTPMGIQSPGDFIGAKIMALFTDTKLFPDGTENWSYTRSLMYINTNQYD